jgi:hypothetical protein
MMLIKREFLHPCVSLYILNHWRNVRFEVFMAVAMKNAVFWDVMPCGSLRWLLVMANIVPSLPILVTLMMEALGSSDT